MIEPLAPVLNYWWMYLAFAGLVVCLLCIDLWMHDVAKDSIRIAAIWSAVWMFVALAFCAVLYWFVSVRLGGEVGRRLSAEFLAGYVLEKSLSVDNMFVFALVFRYFAIPPAYQHRVLFFGVLGAMVFRGVFIAAGSVLVRFEWALIVFGAFLIYTGLRLAWEKESRVEPSQSAVIRIASRLLPVTGELRGPRFFARVAGRLHATPLLIVLLFMDSTDIMFAVDSVPAVFGVTREPFVVYSSNIFAILGLRSLFFLLAGALERFRHLKFGLAAVLVVVGLKMVCLDFFAGGRFPIGVSLAIIVILIGASVGLSYVNMRQCVRRVRGGSPRRAAEVVIGLIFCGFAAVAR